MSYLCEIRKGAGFKASVVLFVFRLAMTFLGSEVLTSCTTEVYLGPVVNTELSKTISAGIKLVINTYEGAAAGNYARGSKAPLVASITTAQVVYADKNSTQVMVDNANMELNAAIAVYQSQIIVGIDPQNLVGQWTFDQVAVATVGVTIQDYSGNKNNGVINAGHPFWGAGTPALAVDRYGVDTKAIHFDKGANIEIPYNTLLNTSNMSIALWVKIDSTGAIRNNQYLVSMNRNGGYHLNYMDTQKMGFTVNPAENPGGILVGSNASALVPGKWFHLVVTFGKGHMVFFVNGIQDYDIQLNGTVLQQVPGVSLVFGQDLPTSLYTYNALDSHYVNGGGYLSGTLDEIRIYKSILTTDQISSIYNLEKP